ncbi:metalloregulator ArsR/SmtB family transcription factor [Telluribacter sp. SYSU D00476]|uniref:metalloregulator ArsR/SmtB family transcription factor n=1 Tax=Telluribacter sp. SYSU D00476 TaxID=2811430 RepID=UPI001FF4F517|nr:metalloregulator ArsR/SmtB family transcription factor [Telluribacter sp. SYSU D00476]
MEKREFKERVYGGIAQMTKALSNPHRLEIIELLAQGEKTVEVIAAEVRATVANASQHLQVLKQSRLVNTRKQGHYVYYRLSSPEVFQAWLALRTLSIRELPEVEKVVNDFRKEKNSLEGVSIEELIQKLQADEVIMLDVRPTEEYLLGHIPRAISVPPAEWEQQLLTLPSDKEIIAYCRGPFCVFADDAVALLKSKGYRATRLEAGFPDWKHQGLPVELN